VKLHRFSEVRMSKITPQSFCTLFLRRVIGRWRGHSGRRQKHSPGHVNEKTWHAEKGFLVKEIVLKPPWWRINVGSFSLRCNVVGSFSFSLHHCGCSGGSSTYIHRRVGCRDLILGNGVREVENGAVAFQGQCCDVVGGGGHLRRGEGAEPYAGGLARFADFGDPFSSPGTDSAVEWVPLGRGWGSHGGSVLF